jgi:hypothetical protein
MGSPSSPEPALFFAAIFSGDYSLIIQSREQLEQSYGQVLHSTGVFDFDHTDYYEDEMGRDLKKEIFLFSDIVDPGSIPDIKLDTNRIEKELSRGSQRDVNIDPGYITLTKVILATTKNYSHRMYIGSGIYCEITLSWEKGTFRPNPWTYPDYKDKDIIGFFNTCRNSLKNG